MGALEIGPHRGIRRSDYQQRNLSHEGEFQECLFAHAATTRARLAPSSRLPSKHHMTVSAEYAATIPQNRSHPNTSRFSAAHPGLLITREFLILCVVKQFCCTIREQTAQEAVTEGHDS